MFKLEFSEQELNIIFNALGQRPFVEVAQLVGRLQQEVQQQVTPRAAENETPKSVESK